MPLQLTGEEMKESSQNISGQQNASSQLNNVHSENAHVTKVLFVCHGNICRSTMAQYVMQDLVEKKRSGRFVCH